MTVRIIFFNGFVGRTAKARERIIGERVMATLSRFNNLLDNCPQEVWIDRVIVVGEHCPSGNSDVEIMQYLGLDLRPFKGISVDRIELAGNASDTLHAIRLFLAKLEEFYPAQHVRVHAATHRWLLQRTAYYMRAWRNPKGTQAPVIKVRDCCPIAGYDPNWWERFREWSRWGDAQQEIHRQNELAL
jgi:hypothetical protein